LRRVLRECGVPYACEACGVAGEWNGKPIILHVDHVSGDWLDNRKENLRFLCPELPFANSDILGQIKE
jgi:hypothetical protein